MAPHNTITDVPGIRVGHAHDIEAITGCTVVLCPQGAVGGVDQRGGAPGTRETDLLSPMSCLRADRRLVSMRRRALCASSRNKTWASMHM